VVVTYNPGGSTTQAQAHIVLAGTGIPTSTTPGSAFIAN
jgi:hypothetical protein